MCERGGRGAVLGLFVPKAADTCVEEVGVGRAGGSTSVHPVSSADPPAASGFPPWSLREQWLTDQASLCWRSACPGRNFTSGFFLLVI